MPWYAAWRITQLTGGKVRFVMASSGHIAGVINHPGPRKGSTGSTRAGRHARGVAGGGRAPRGQLVDRLDRLARRARADGRPAVARQRQAPAAGGRRAPTSWRSSEAPCARAPSPKKEKSTTVFVLVGLRLAAHASGSCPPNPLRRGRVRARAPPRTGHARGRSRHPAGRASGPRPRSADVPDGYPSPRPRPEPG